jgi:hypothetical protein
VANEGLTSGENTKLRCVVRAQWRGAGAAVVRQCIGRETRGAGAIRVLRVRGERPGVLRTHVPRARRIAATRDRDKEKSCT